jgi:uncharacterized protein YybS (DUF2232 family)
MNLKSLAWSAAALILLLTLAAPLIMIPFIVLYTMLRPKGFILHLIPIGVIAYFLLGAYGPDVLKLGFFFLVPSLAMGHVYKRGKTARLAIIVGSVVILAQLLLVLVLSSILFNFDLEAKFIAMMTDSLKHLETGDLFAADGVVNTANTLGDAFMIMLPRLLLLFAFLFAIVAHALARLALRTVDIQAPALPLAKTWRIPKSLVAYYLIAMVASLAIPDDISGYWSIAILNLIPVLSVAFIVQAIGFFFFLADTKKWPRIVPLLLCIPLILFPPFYMIGFLDAAFPLRKYFLK